MASVDRGGQEGDEGDGDEVDAFMPTSPATGMPTLVLERSRRCVRARPWPRPDRARRAARVDRGYDGVVSSYRDPLAGLRSQIATKRGLIEGRERGLPEILRVMLPNVIASRLAELRPRAGRDGETFEALSDVDVALDEMIATLDAAAHALPRLRECPDTVPDPPHPVMGPPWSSVASDPAVSKSAPSHSAR
jgi:hypothetical protein